MNMTRAYSLLEIKEVDDDARRITGLATTPAPDRVGDVVMPEGAQYSLPLPLLWQHNASQPIGHVIEAKVTKQGIEIVAEIAKGVSEEIDRALKLIKAGLVRGLSIGFRGIETEQIPNSWGVIFEKWEWLELSAVTIPANAEATIQSVKKFDTHAPAAPGQQERAAKPGPGASGKTIKPVDLRPKEGTEMKTISEQIEALEATRQTKATRMAEVMQKSIDEGRSTDAAEQEEFDTLEQEVEAIDGDLKRLRALEKTQAAAAKPVNGVKADDGTGSRNPTVAAQVKVNHKLDPGIGFARLAKVKALAKLDGESPRALAKELYGEDSPIFGILSKAAVAAGTTGNATWAGALVGDESSVFADFVEFLRPSTILGRFGLNGIPGLRRVPFRVALIGQTTGGQGYWVGEGKAKPLTKFDFNRTTLEPLKVANIAVLTEEVLRDSSPSAEAIVRDQLAAALRARLDTDFIDPAKAAAAGVSPASITNGAATVASTGTDADAIRLDVRALFQKFVDANNPPSTGVWIMSSTTALALSLMVNALGQREFPNVGMTGGTFEGLPVIVSDYVDGIVVLANASDIYLADDGGIAVDMSREASLEMDDAPTHSSDTPTETSLVSLWQTNSVGFRAERTINWARRRTSAVAYLTGVNWGGAVPAS